VQNITGLLRWAVGPFFVFADSSLGDGENFPAAVVVRLGEYQ